jgi:NADH-quinone oxidoreductase subunit C
LANLAILSDQLQSKFAEKLLSITVAVNEITIEVAPKHLLEICVLLRDEAEFKFEQLMDVCGVDYSDYGISEWQTDRATSTGFERGVDYSHELRKVVLNKPRFAVVYHLLSISLNHRLRIRTFAEGEPPIIPSVVDIWASANWFEREAFDLFGILFEGHPDLRRILTDYGFIGHPFRKDFPLIGNVEVRYDATLKRVIYEPVSIESRTLVPKVIRKDSRYLIEELEHKK